MKVYFNMNTK